MDENILGPSAVNALENEHQVLWVNRVEIHLYTPIYPKLSFASGEASKKCNMGIQSWSNGHLCIQDSSQENLVIPILWYFHKKFSKYNFPIVDVWHIFLTSNSLSLKKKQNILSLFNQLKILIKEKLSLIKYKWILGSTEFFLKYSRYPTNHWKLQTEERLGAIIQTQNPK